MSIGTIASADTVTLNNGDKINGKVGEIAGGKMKFASPVLGDIVIDMTNVQTFSTDEPATIRLKSGGAPLSDKVTAGSTGKYDLAGGKSVDAPDVKAFNPPPQKWTGTIVLNAEYARGNSDDFTVGATAAAVYRRDDQFNDDRFTLGAEYNFARTGTGSNAQTSADNWLATAKYDYFYTEKFYGFLSMEYDHDRLADLDYRLIPTVGLGYQWVERPDFNFNTEIGFGYVYEQFSDHKDDHVVLRLAYHLDKQLTAQASLFHNLEYLPAIDDPGDYNLNADAGVKFLITKTLFSQFKIEYKRDSVPAESAQKNDVRLMLGIGYSF